MRLYKVKTLAGGDRARNSIYRVCSRWCTLMAPLVERTEVRVLTVSRYILHFSNDVLLPVGQGVSNQT